MAGIGREGLGPDNHQEDRPENHETVPVLRS